MNYTEMVKIDPYNLDGEWQIQSEYMLQCGEALAQARRELDEAKEAYDLIVAGVDRRIRDTADKKPAEREIENLIILDTDVQDAKKALTQAKYNVSLLGAARAGIESPGAALTNLVKLHGMSYFSEPAADIVARGELEELRQQSFRSKVRINKTGKQSEQPEKMFRRKQ